MSLEAKYAAVLQFGEELGVQDAHVEEKDGALVVRGMVRTVMEKNMMWDKIKEVAGGSVPDDLKANITVENPAILAFHTVSSGETLSKIAASYYGDGSQYKAIFEANSDILDNPNAIKVGQDLVIPMIEG